MSIRSFKKYALLFFIGAAGYAAIETIWRGYTHWSMVIAGGICFILFSLVAKRMKGRSIFLKAAVCALCITAVEFIFGLIFNVALKMNVWDYSSVPFNIHGQVCLLYTLLWGVLGAMVLPIADMMDRKLRF